MIFKCKNCGGNTVFSPERQKMFCPYCEGEGSEELKKGGDSLHTCLNCGGEIAVNDYLSASKCPYCDHYLIFDERVEGEYEPHLMIPFKLGKEGVKKLLRQKFKSAVFAPSDFLSEVRLKTIEGMYVPFFLYDYAANWDYEGEGTKIRKWISGNTEYTEISYYQLIRNMDIDFNRIPVDASIAMEDSVMDLMEPYDYEAMETFQAKYMSGFFGERYNETMEELGYRAKQKAKRDSEALLQATLGGYNTSRAIRKEFTIDPKESDYTLFPVWIYSYYYKGEEYRFHVNGQTGKIVGKVPVSKGKVIGYGVTLYVILTIMMVMLEYIVRVII